MMARERSCSTGVAAAFFVFFDDDAFFVPLSAAVVVADFFFFFFFFLLAFLVTGSSSSSSPSMASLDGTKRTTTRRKNRCSHVCVCVCESNCLRVCMYVCVYLHTVNKQGGGGTLPVEPPRISFSRHPGSGWARPKMDDDRSARKTFALLLLLVGPRLASTERLAKRVASAAAVNLIVVILVAVFSVGVVDGVGPVFHPLLLCNDVDEDDERGVVVRLGRTTRAVERNGVPFVRSCFAPQKCVTTC